MALQLANLDELTRTLMVEELEIDVANGTLYLSTRLNSRGQDEYEQLLRTAFLEGDDESLADEIRSMGLLNATEQRRKPFQAGFDEPAATGFALHSFSRLWVKDTRVNSPATLWMPRSRNCLVAASQRSNCLSASIPRLRSLQYPASAVNNRGHRSVAGTPIPARFWSKSSSIGPNLGLSALWGVTSWATITPLPASTRT